MEPKSHDTTQNFSERESDVLSRLHLAEIADVSDLDISAFPPMNALNLIELLESQQRSSQIPRNTAGNMNVLLLRLLLNKEIWSHKILPYLSREIKEAVNEWAAVVLYGRRRMMITSGHDSDEESKDDEHKCSVCLDDFGLIITHQLECNHKFHVKVCVKLQ
jgi:hypothetical protein